MELPEILAKVSEILNITETEAMRILTSSFTELDPFQHLTDLLGYSHIDLIFEIFKQSSVFEAKDIVTDKLLFVEHVIPETPKVHRTDNLINTKDLGDSAKYFSYKQFNPVQSTVFKDIYNSNSNILISAPTGAGKTDIALLAILKALKSKGSQIIYIVPMKALSNEIFHKYSKVFDSKYSVVEYTGDTEVDYKTAQHARIIVCTPEKFDSATRKHNCAFVNVKLVVIDEIHLLEDDRGPVLESIVARLFKLIEIKQRQIRIIGLSATLPNYKDVAEFIKAKAIHFFDSSYRPVPLKMTVTGFTKISSFKDQQDYLIESVTKFLSMNKQILIFVHSRGKTFKTANYLRLNLSNIQSDTLIELNIKADLLSLINSSIGIHHAGMPKNERHIMERLFKEGKLKILVCTSTLAWGVNLPAYAVIINGSEFYNPSKGQIDNISILDVLQIFGRAGRPQFDNGGEAILMTSANKIDTYIRLLKRSEDIESKMLFSVPECINSEIYLKNIFSISTALTWIKNTFLYVRMMKNPVKYGVSADELGMEEQALSEYIYLTVKRLEDCKLIKIDKKDMNYNTWTFASTFYGQVASLFYLNHLTMYSWLQELDSINDEMSLIKLLIKSQEFKNITIRKDEIGCLNNIHQDLILDCVDLDFDELAESKLLLLFISYLRYRRAPTYSLCLDTDFLIENMKRLVGAMKQILLFTKKFDIYLLVYLLEKQIYRYKKQKMNNCTVNAKKLNENYVQISIDCNVGECTVFLFENKRLFDVLKIFEHSKYIIPCDRDKISIKIHSDKDWFIHEKDIDLKQDYSISNLYHMGTHTCDRIFNLYGKRSNCIHFQELELFNKFGSTLTLSENEKLNIINKGNFRNKIRQIEETYNNIIDINYTLDVEFVDIESFYFNERLKLATTLIDNFNFKNCLIVCPTAKDVDETFWYLNTKSALNSINGIGKYKKIKSVDNNKATHMVCTFKDALSVIGYDNAIIKSASNNNGLFPMAEIFRICDRRKSIIFDTRDNVNYIRSIIDN